MSSSSSSVVSPVIGAVNSGLFRKEPSERKQNELELEKPSVGLQQEIQPKKEERLLKLKIERLEETRKIKDIVDAILWSKQKGDKNKETLQGLFCEVISASADEFSGKSVQEKADLLFNGYRTSFLSILKKNEKFQEYRQEIRKKFSVSATPQVIDEVITAVVLGHIQQLHSFSLEGLFSQLFSVSRESIDLRRLPDFYEKCELGAALFAKFLSSE